MTPNPLSRVSDLRFAFMFATSYNPTSILLTTPTHDALRDAIDASEPSPATWTLYKDRKSGQPLWGLRIMGMVIKPGSEDVCE